MIVTGAGSGIRRATAVAFCREGAKVIVAARAQETVDLACRAGGSAQAILVDAGKPDSVENLVEKTVAADGGLDVFFGNAGIFDYGAECGDISHDLWDHLRR